MTAPAGTRTGASQSSGLDAELAFLKQVHLFADLDEAQLTALLGILMRRYFRAGEVIIHEGELGESMYVLLEGRVDISKSLTLKVGRHQFEQADKSLSEISADQHECLGEMGVIGQDERSATVQAVTDCTVLEMGREDFERFCRADPLAGYLIARRVVEAVSERLRSANRDILKLTTALSLALSR